MIYKEHSIFLHRGGIRGAHPARAPLTYVKLKKMYIFYFLSKFPSSANIFFCQKLPTFKLHNINPTGA